ncbi:GIY-YIG nuclease family protein [Synechococcus sp. PCC 6312]|uniref:GIY-YIG nuclease family protein n=1 Tax=Synechococcus sp. (strain ATCC 27167 / PCC 6312) TaxID=195253 RepID=UPI00029F0205|nr:putative endonuclease [Synechococcus sp. PCC 6312]
MPIHNSEIHSQAQDILDAIAFTPFECCQPISRDFMDIPCRPGVYAIRHRTRGLLYIGKTQNLRGRFKGGHKAFLWAWLDQYLHEDVRIAIQTIPYSKNPALLLELESIILRATEPPYNVKIPMES